MILSEDQKCQRYGFQRLLNLHTLRNKKQAGKERTHIKVELKTFNNILGLRQKQLIYCEYKQNKMVYCQNIARSFFKPIVLLNVPFERAIKTKPIDFSGISQQTKMEVGISGLVLFPQFLKHSRVDVQEGKDRREKEELK